MSSLKLVFSVFSRVLKPKPLCHLLLDMPPSQRTLNLSVVAVICLWFWGRGSGRRAHFSCQKEPIPLWSHKTPAPSSHRSCTPECKVPGLGRLHGGSDCVWRGKEGQSTRAIYLFLTFPAQPEVGFAHLLCTQCSGSREAAVAGLI